LDERLTRVLQKKVDFFSIAENAQYDQLSLGQVVHWARSHDAGESDLALAD
jgi:hypothetical protein